MNSSILCHYTFHSNEVSPIGAIIMLSLMGIFIVIGIRFWIGDKVDDYKLNKERKNRESYLTDEAETILSSEINHDEKLRQIKYKYNWKNWFIKGYIDGATWGNMIFGPLPSYLKKPSSEITLEEWEDYQKIYMKHIKEDSDYFGGNKDIALYGFFIGHRYGYDRYLKKGEAK